MPDEAVIRVVIQGATGYSQGIPRPEGIIDHSESSESRERLEREIYKLTTDVRNLDEETRSTTEAFQDFTSELADVGKGILSSIADSATGFVGTVFSTMEHDIAQTISESILGGVQEGQSEGFGIRAKIRDFMDNLVGSAKDMITGSSSEVAEPPEPPETPEAPQTPNPPPGPPPEPATNPAPVPNDTGPMAVAEKIGQGKNIMTGEDLRRAVEAGIIPPERIGKKGGHVFTNEELEKYLELLNGGSAGFAQGGIVGEHPGKPQGTDTVPAWLTPGERIIDRNTAAANKPALDRMTKHMAGGGETTTADVPMAELAPASKNVDALRKAMEDILNSNYDPEVIAKATANVPPLEENIPKAELAPEIPTAELVPQLDLAKKAIIDIIGAIVGIVQPSEKAADVVEKLKDVIGGVSPANIGKGAGQVAGAAAGIAGEAAVGVAGKVGSAAVSAGKTAIGAGAEGIAGFASEAGTAGMAIPVVGAAIMAAGAASKVFKGVVDVFSTLKEVITSPDTDFVKPLEALGKTASEVGGKLGPLGEIAGDAVVTFSHLITNISAIANKYEEFNAHISYAQAVAEVQQTLGDIRRANEVGPDMAKFIMAKQDVQNKWEEIKIELLKEIIPLVTKVLEALSIIMPSGKSITGALEGLMVPITSIPQALMQLIDLEKDKRLPDAEDPTNLILGTEGLAGGRFKYPTGQVGTIPGD